jgi:hypothetical protein
MYSARTDDGYTLIVYDAGYSDWALQITKDDKEVYSNPHCLSADFYGCDLDSNTPWSDEEWTEVLYDEADELVETFAVDHSD